MEHDINEILKNLEIPEPDETARSNTVEAALAEFNLHNIPVQEKIIKGIEEEPRLTGILNIFYTFFGGRVMKRSFLIASGVTVLLAIAGYSLFYYISGINYTPENIIGSTKGIALLGNNNQSGVIVVQNEVGNNENQDISGQYSGDIAIHKSLRNELKKLEEPVLEMQSANSTMLLDVLEEQPAVAYKSKQAPGIRSEIRTFDKRMINRLVRPGMPADIKPDTGYQDVGRDKFDQIESNPVKQVSENPVSTFSIDVDTASYAFVRRELNNGRLPQKNAVRIEEMINYFKYDYPVPGDKTKPFQPDISIYPSPWNKDRKLLQIGIKGYDIIPGEKLTANLVFLIDVSGSMNADDKLPLLKNSIRMLVNSLNEEDTVAIVVYAGSAGTVLETTKVKEKGKILAALEQLNAGGSTAGGEGIEKAYALAESSFNKNAVNRIILATDGDFNVGISNPEELKSFVERKRETGVFLSILGFGQGNYNDALMQKLAQNGNGNAAYIDNLNEARKVLVEEAGSTLFPIANDVKIQVEFNPELVAEYRLIGYESRMLKREDFNNDKVDAGDIGSGHSVTAIYEFTPVDSKNRQVDDLRYTENSSSDIVKSEFDMEYGFLKIRYKLPDSDRSNLITTPITTANEYKTFDEASADSRFATAVAAFGQLLKGGIHTGDFKFEDVLQIAKSATSYDQFGYRHEFLNLVRLAMSIK